MLEQILSLGHTLLSFAVILSVIVFIHEFGHYWVARRCGVRVEQFSIGFGKEIYGWDDRHGTRWKISLLPLGGYVKMYGDSDPASTPDASTLTQMNDAEKAVSFHYKTLRQKAAIVVAGPAANFILAIIILTGFFMTMGRPHTPPVVGDLQPESAALAAGVQKGDLFLEIDGRKMEYFSDIQRITRLHKEGAMTAKIDRNGEIITLQLTPKVQLSKDVFGNEVNLALLGISSGPATYEKLSPGNAVVASVVETYRMCVDTLRALGQMITGQRSVTELGGPIKIAKYSGQSAEQGLTTVLWFMAVLSVNLGLINLFPIPMLDGGHLLFYTLEAARGRPMAEKIQNVAFRFGFALLITLMVFTTVNDVVQLF
jgi:regulator of sigma E protease